MKTRNRLCFNLVILFSMVLIQAMSFFIAPSSSHVFYNIIRPMAYLVLLTLVLIFTSLDIAANKRHKEMSMTILVLGSVVYVGLLFVAALVTSLGRNPMSADLVTMWRYLPFVLVGEVIRFQLVHNTPKKYKTLMLWAITLVMAFSMINPNMVGFSGEFIFAHLLPVLAVNFFLTYVCRGGSLAGVLCFRAAYSLIPVFLPVLPNITTLLLAILTYVAIVVMLSLYNKYAREQERKVILKRKSRAWIVATPLILFIVVASFGLFPTALVAVASNSMKGEFSRGDIVVMRTLDSQQTRTDLKMGDIIQFRDGSRYTIHRIIEVRSDLNDEPLYITKGDNNEYADSSPVSPGQVIAVARFKIPFLGFPSVLLMEMMG